MAYAATIIIRRTDLVVWDTQFPHPLLDEILSHVFPFASHLLRSAGRCPLACL